MPDAIPPSPRTFPSSSFPDSGEAAAPGQTGSSFDSLLAGSLMTADERKTFVEVDASEPHGAGSESEDETPTAVEDGQSLPLAAVLFPPPPLQLEVRWPLVGDVSASGVAGDDVIPSSAAPRGFLPGVEPADPDVAAEEPLVTQFEALLDEHQEAAGFDALDGVDARGGPTTARPIEPPARMDSRIVSAPRIETPVGQPGWDRALGERIAWLVGKEVQHARIQLDTEHLGPLDIRVDARHDQLSVAIAASHATTHEALSASLARLREQLAGGAFQQIELCLADPGLAQGQPGGGRGDPGADGGASAARGDAAPAEGEPLPDGDGAGPMLRAVGLLDDYA